MRREPHDSYEHERRQTAALERIVQLLERLVPVPVVRPEPEWHEYDCGAPYGAYPHWHPKDDD